MKTKLLPLLLFTFATNAFAALDTPTEDFIDNNDGTVLHKKTGLIWQSCAVGQTWSGAICDGTASTMNWDTAVATYENKTDCNQWRLPRIDEIDSIVEHGIAASSINKVVFPNTSDVNFWSSTPHAKYANLAWYTSNFTSKDTNNAVRLVRGGEKSCSLDIFTPTSDFEDNGNGMITHKKTGLMWQRCSIGQVWDGAVCTGNPTLMDYASALKLLQYDYSNTLPTPNRLGNYWDWRLPTTNEIKTIVDYSTHSPAINSSVFPNTPYGSFGSSSAGFFWSSPSVDNLDIVWVVSFGNGLSMTLNKTDLSAVRLVRTAFYPSIIDLTATITSPTNRAKVNDSIIYTGYVANNGTGTASNVQLKFYLPPRNVSITSMPSDCVTTGKSLTCSLGNLAKGANASRAITVSYTKSGGASVSALVLTDSNDKNSENNVSRVVTAIKK